jgi:hypothetical protein
MTEPKKLTPEQIQAIFPQLTIEEAQSGVLRVVISPVSSFLNEISEADTQKEVADLLVKHRDFLQGLPRHERKEVMQQVNEMIEEKPVI